MDTGKATLQWAGFCYGVDVQGDRVVAVRAGRSRGRVQCTVVDVAEVAAARTSRKHLPVAGCLGARESLTRRLEAPFASPRKAGRVFPTLLDIQLPFALDECVYDFLDVEKTGTGAVRGLAVAARHADVEQRLETFDRLGLDPLCLDQEGLALWTQSQLEHASARGELRAVVNLAGVQSAMAVGQGATFLNSHAVKAGDVRQISRLLRAALAQHGAGGETTEPAAGAAPIRWIWTGPGAREAGLLSGMQSQLDREWPGGTHTTLEAPEAFLARAIATRALVPGPLRCNLRSASFSHPALAARTRHRQAAAAVFLLATGLSLCALSVALQAMARRQEAQIDRSIGVLHDQLAGYHVTAKGQDALKVCTEAVQRRIQEARPFHAAFQPSWVTLIADIAAVGRTNGLHIATVSLAPDTVQVTGTGAARKSAESLAAALRQHGLDVALEAKEAPDRQTISFTVGSRGGL